MKLNGEQMEQVLEIINEAVDIATLRRIVRFSLNENLEDVSRSGTKKDIVFEVIEWAERFSKLTQLVDGFLRTFPQRSEELNAAIASGKITRLQPNDPLAKYFPYKEPVVDRHDLGLKLDTLWADEAGGVLVVRGERWRGRSHSLWRIRAVAQIADIDLRYIDISKDPSEWTVARLVGRTAGWFGISLQELPDQAAQSSKIGEAFISELDGRLSCPELQSRRFCLVLDGLDRTGVSDELCEFVERIVGEIVARNLSNLSIILLGYAGSFSSVNFSQLILEEHLNPICRGDARTFLREIANAVAIILSEEEVELEVEEIFKGLPEPLDGDAMREFRSRTLKRSRAVLSRARRGGA